MGNSVSVQPVATSPMVKSPVQDGASGLHYSGRIYMNTPPDLGGANVCANTPPVTPDHIADILPNSISTTALPMDPTTHRIDSAALQQYVANLTQTGIIPGSAGSTSFDEQMKADAAFHAAVASEYCFYDARYVASLTDFLALVAAPTPDSPAIQAALKQTVALNARLNSLLEILNTVSNERARAVQQRSPQMERANAALNEKLAALYNQQRFLTSSDARIRTQEEMVRFSAEKAQAMNIQIMFFVALNVVALGTVMTVYRSMGPK